MRDARRTCCVLVKPENINEGRDDYTTKSWSSDERLASITSLRFSRSCTCIPAVYSAFFRTRDNWHSGLSPNALRDFARVGLSHNVSSDTRSRSGSWVLTSMCRCVWPKPPRNLIEFVRYLCLRQGKPTWLPTTFQRLAFTA